MEQDITPRRQRSMLSAGAGASGRDDISGRIEELLALELPQSARS